MFRDLAALLGVAGAGFAGARVQDLAGKRLVIVAGKGGVGKTTTSAGVALHLAKLGRKTLLVTV